MNLAKVLFWQPQAIVPCQQTSDLCHGKILKCKAGPFTLLVVPIYGAFRGEFYVTKDAGTAKASKSRNVIFE